MKAKTVKITVELSDFDGNPEEVVRFGVSRQLPGNIMVRDSVNIEIGRRSCLESLFSRLMMDNNFLIEWRKKNNDKTGALERIIGTLRVVIPDDKEKSYKKYLKEKGE